MLVARDSIEYNVNGQKRKIGYILKHDKDFDFSVFEDLFLKGYILPTEFENVICSWSDDKRELASRFKKSIQFLKSNCDYEICKYNVVDFVKNYLSLIKGGEAHFNIENISFVEAMCNLIRDESCEIYGSIAVDGLRTYFESELIPKEVKKEGLVYFRSFIKEYVFSGKSVLEIIEFLSSHRYLLDMINSFTEVYRLLLSKKREVYKALCNGEVDCVWFVIDTLYPQFSIMKANILRAWEKNGCTLALDVYGDLSSEDGEERKTKDKQYKLLKDKVEIKKPFTILPKKPKE